MTLVTRQAMSDDSGTFTDGTAVNKAFIDQLYDQMDDQVHSATNPTVKPKATTDEVITARGSKASLDARLDVSLNEDGTLKSQASLVAAADYQAGLGGRNVALNGDLEDWTNGGAAAPDDWTLSAGTIARTGSGQADTFQFGTGESGYAAKVTRAGANITLKQVVIAGGSFTNFANVKSQKFGVAMKGKTALANALRIVVDDGVSTTASSYHTGGNTEEHLSALHTISNTATKLEVYASFETSAGDSYVGGFIFVFANLAPADWQPLSREAVATATRRGIVALQSMQAYPKWKPGSSSTVDATGVGRIHADKTTVGNVGGGEDDLMSKSVNANTLAADGDTLRIVTKGRFAANANNKRVRAYFGGTLIFDSGATAWNSYSWILICHVMRTGAATQITWSEFRTYNTLTATSAGITGGDVRGAAVSTAIDLTAAAIVKLTGEATADNDIQQDAMHIMVP